MCGMMFGWLAPTYHQVWVVGKLLMEHHKKRVEVWAFFQNFSFAMQTILADELFLWLVFGTANY